MKQFSDQSVKRGRTHSRKSEVVETPNVEQPVVRREAPAIALLLGALTEQCLERRRHLIQRRLAVAGVEGVDEDQFRQSVGGHLGDAGDDHARVAVADEHHIVQITVDEHGNDIIDVALECDVR